MRGVTMQIIVPAYNIDPKLASRFEDRVARIMHQRRQEEINRFREVKLPPKKGRDPVLVGEARLPDRKLTGSAKGRENSATDELILKLLREREMSIPDLSGLMGMSRQAIRHAVERLVGRKQLRRRHTPTITVFSVVGVEQQPDCNQV